MSLASDSYRRSHKSSRTEGVRRVEVSQHDAERAHPNEDRKYRHSSHRGRDADVDDRYAQPRDDAPRRVRRGHAPAVDSQPDAPSGDDSIPAQDKEDMEAIRK